MKHLVIYNLLSQGKENAIPGKSLINALGVKERELYKQIERERRMGAAILAKKEEGGGFYLPANEEEKADYLHTAMNDIISNLRTYHAVKYAGRQLDSELEELIRGL